MSDTNRPEPVLDEGKIAGVVTGVVTAVLGVLAVLGLASQEDTSTVVTACVAVATGIAALINFLVPKWRAWKARAKVTPLSNPKSARGVPLVESDTGLLH